jgi:hypothetical protein
MRCRAWMPLGVLASIQTELGQLRSSGASAAAGAIPADSASLERLGARVEQLATLVDRHDSRLPSSGTGWHVVLLIMVVFVGVLVIVRPMFDDI